MVVMQEEVEYIWDWSLIVLSYINACMGAWIGVKLLWDARHYIKNIKFYFAFILLAAFGFGLCGVWTMHYTGMLAYKFTHVRVTYDVPLAILSGAVAVILVFIGFFYVSHKVEVHQRDNQSIWKIKVRKPNTNDLIHCLIGGVIIAIGVSTMHYVGMAALIIDATQEWQTGIVILSILIAIIVSFVGLLLLLFIDGIYGGLVSCLVIGFAVCTMHYTGMYAVKYYHNNDTIWVSDIDGAEGFAFTAQLISTLSGCMVSMILILYHIIKFYQYRDTFFYKKRYGQLIIVTNVFGLFYIIFGSVHVFINISENTSTAGHIINEFLLLFAFYGLLASLLLRYILAWYSINLLSTKENLTWQTILNSKLIDIANKSFFFVNYTKYGNIKWLSIRIYMTFGTLLLIDFAFYLVKFVILGTIVIPLIILVSTLIVITYFYRNTPSSFNDQLYIFGEMKLIAFVLLVMSVSALCGYIIICDHTKFGIYYTFLTMICLTIIAIIPIEILLHKQHNSHKNSKHSKKTLVQCLSNLGSFESFIKHLNKEYAMEVLLFIVEQTQWKNHWKDLFDISSGDTSPQSCSPPASALLKNDGSNMAVMLSRKMSENYNKEIDITLPKNMPESVIVHGYKHDIEAGKILTDAEKIRYCKESGYRLYEKYILENSEFEVNISWIMRGNLNFLMDNYDEWMKDDDENLNITELITIFDSTCRELYSLLEQPYSRFLLSEY